MSTNALSHCCTTQVICEPRVSSSIVEVAAWLAAFVGVGRGRGVGRGTIELPLGRCDGMTRVGRIAFIGVANASECR